MKKEKELAERRKNDPALNHTQDHLVRKLFSKFKRGPSSGQLDSAEKKDVEKGAGRDILQADNNGIPPGKAYVIIVITTCLVGTGSAAK